MPHLQVFFRLNEVDDMLDSVQQGAVGVSEARQAVQAAKAQARPVSLGFMGFFSSKTSKP